MKEEDITKFIYTSARSIELSENRLKSTILVLRKLGLEGEALSELVAREPRLFTALEKDVIEWGSRKDQRCSHMLCGEY